MITEKDGKSIYIEIMNLITQKYADVKDQCSISTQLGCNLLAMVGASIPNSQARTDFYKELFDGIEKDAANRCKTITELRLMGELLQKESSNATTH